MYRPADPDQAWNSANSVAKADEPVRASWWKRLLREPSASEVQPWFDSHRAGDGWAETVRR
jgi:hypothetical protein